MSAFSVEPKIRFTGMLKIMIGLNRSIYMMVKTETEWLV
jgi:hypothetical protein